MMRYERVATCVLIQKSLVVSKKYKIKEIIWQIIKEIDRLKK
jgi:hypothetical protein